MNIEELSNRVSALKNDAIKRGVSDQELYLGKAEMDALEVAFFGEVQQPLNKAEIRVPLEFNGFFVHRVDDPSWCEVGSRFST